MWTEPVRIQVLEWTVIRRESRLVEFYEFDCEEPHGSMSIHGYAVHQCRSSLVSPNHDCCRCDYRALPRAVYCSRSSQGPSED